MLGALQGNDAANVNGTAAATASKTANGTTTAVASSTVDRTSLSAASLSAAGLASQGTDTSDVRLTKVSELRSAILSGTYSVSASDVADKMVESMLK
jgi:negative regulator of flagellin synthesis FlgM